MVAIRAVAREVPVLKPADVRFGAKADMTGRICNVRFTPKSGHRSARWQCPLCANSGRRDTLIDDLINLCS
jgi:hypothetical protein